MIGFDYALRIMAESSGVRILGASSHQKYVVEVLAIETGIAVRALSDH